MARTFVTDADQSPVRFLTGQRTQAFQAAVLVAGRLECEAEVVRRHDPEDDLPYLGIQLERTGPTFSDEEVRVAAELCALAREG